MEHVHERQPYGHVVMENCRIEVRHGIVEYGSYGQPNKMGDVTYVVGTVKSSRHIGAFFGGVAISKPREYQPVGTAYECRINGPLDLDRHRTVDVSM